MWKGNLTYIHLHKWIQLVIKHINVFRHTSVQQHPDDFLFWGSLCNTMASSLVSAFWLNILATTQQHNQLQGWKANITAPRILKDILLKLMAVIDGTRQNKWQWRMWNVLPGHSFQRLNHIFTCCSATLHEFKVVLLWK